MKKYVQKFGRVAESLGIGLFVLLILTPIYSFAQSRADAVRSVNALLNGATRSDREDRNRGMERERFTLPDRASPMAHAVLSAIAQTAGSPDTINRGQRAEAIHEAMSEVIQPSEIAANILHEEKGFRDDREKADKITKEMAKAIEEKLSSHSDFKLAFIEAKKDLKEREQEQKFEEKFGDRNKSERSDLVSQITNFNDGKESKSKELERLAFNKSSGRSGKGGGGGGSGADNAQAKSDNAQVAKADNAQAGTDKADDKKPEDKGKK